mgnify:CR=1 FL=1
MGRAEYKVKGGKLIKVQLTTRNKRIEKIKITGDFFLHPEEIIENIERSLEGCMLNEHELSSRIETVMRDKQAVSLGVSLEDFARCIMMAGEKDG